MWYFRTAIDSRFVCRCAGYLVGLFQQAYICTAQGRIYMVLTVFPFHRWCAFDFFCLYMRHTHALIYYLFTTYFIYLFRVKVFLIKIIRIKKIQVRFNSFNYCRKKIITFTRQIDPNIKIIQRKCIEIISRFL